MTFLHPLPDYAIYSGPKGYPFFVPPLKGFLAGGGKPVILAFASRFSFLSTSKYVCRELAYMSWPFRIGRERLGLVCRIWYNKDDGNKREWGGGPGGDQGY